VKKEEVYRFTASSRMFTGHSFYLLAAQKAKNAPFESFCSF